MWINANLQLRNLGYLLNGKYAVFSWFSSDAFLEKGSDGFSYISSLEMFQHLVLVLEQYTRKQLDQLFAL